MNDCGAVNHSTNGSVSRADHFVVGDDRSQPVGEVNDLRTGDAWEEIFVAPRESHHLVREDRSADDELVIIKNEFVQADGDILRHQSACDLFYFCSGEGADQGEVGRVLPLMVVDLTHARLTVDYFPPDQSAQLCVTHRRVSTQRNEIIQRLHLPP